MVCMSVLFWIVFDHFMIRWARNSEKVISALANCLEGSKEEVGWGRMFEILKNVKNASKYNAMNCRGD